MSSPTYDVVLYGATGFTGSIAAQYLAEHPQQPKVAFAGRSEAKIRGLINQLTNVSAERVQSIGVMVANSDDHESLKRMASSAKAIINMVGPYAKYGGYDVAKAAAEAGIGYVDLTGESSVYKRIVRDLHSVAKSTKAIIVPSSGFDSLPFDLTTYLAIQELRKASGGKADVDYALCGYHVHGGVSGGTIASAVGEAKNSDLNFKDAYQLGPIRGTQQAQIVRSRFLPQFNRYGAYTLFTPHNTGIVNRSWGLLQEASDKCSYGASFKYVEGYVTSSYVFSLLVSSIMIFFGYLLGHYAWFGDWLSKKVPQGTGSSMEKQLKGFGNVRTIAVARNGTTKALSSFSVKGDPGYLRTAAFISETALTIALEQSRLSDLARGGGVLTPATIGGEVLAERLSRYSQVKIQSKDVTASTDLSQECI
ncbi:hypothetical protein MCAP1_003329 [Malassezia caprae]|uniref:Saccharopine dehydrogenase NADP binding domain-containing protein n=1 Tax=Malassezia caprae TaxID=1381934 RepID=A0AAF0E8G2_9BASI|nr:hypothetical protein MCAP1_003329 [Malassezia caprae]